MKILLLLPLLLGFSVPAIAHNEANGGCGALCVYNNAETEEGEEGPNRENIDAEDVMCGYRPC